MPTSPRRTTGTAYVHGYGPRESDRLQDQAGALVDLLHSGLLPGQQSSAGSRVRSRSTNRHARSQQAGCAHCVDRCVGRLPRPCAGQGRGSGSSQRGVPAGRHLRSEIQSILVRPRLRLLRAGAPGAAGRGPARAQGAAEARWHDHGHRGGSRFCLLPSRQPGGARGDPVPGGSSAGGRRQRPDRQAALPLVGLRRLRRHPRLASDGLCRRK